MKAEIRTSNFVNSSIPFFVIAVLFFAAALCVNFIFPQKDSDEQMIDVVAEADENSGEYDYELPEDEISSGFQDYLMETSFYSKNSESDDVGLELYRMPESRSSVEWFYYQITGSKDIALSILSEADKNDIPVTLAFALAFTESSFNVRAVNKNSNTTVDRGLFQLNSNTFPKLTEADFFDPYTSAKYGLSHLRFCMNTAGNEVSALAMYNAGTNRVRSNKTPQSTLNYVGKIISYRSTLDELFERQVVSYYETQLVPSSVLVLAKDSK